jgi:hypothetical protein
LANAIEVSDSLSNAEEQIERAAKTVGRGRARPKVFEAIYHHKARVKSVVEIVKRTGLKRLRVLQEGRHLVRSGIVNAAKKDRDTAYEMIEFFHTNKRKILKYAANPKKLAAIPTKRKTSVSVRVTANSRPSRAKAVALTVDDFDSFKAVCKVKPDGYIPRTVSEDNFKRGIQAILSEPGEWKDWGGELFDLASTRVTLRGTRVGTVFAFKGPGKRGPLVPSKMGKNGDQISRMFLADARVFVVQYVEEIKTSITQLMRSIAVEKSVATGDTIYYAVIDGTDSYRLYRAYESKFKQLRQKKHK